MMVGRAGGAAHRRRLNRNIATAPVKQPEHRDQRRLRLDRDHPRAEPPERGDAVADMGADIEHQIAGSHEAAIEPVHRRGARAIAVVDAKRA